MIFSFQLVKKKVSKGKNCFPGGSVVKNLLANAGDTCPIPRSEDPLEKEMATHSTPVFLPGQPYGKRGLVDYSPRLCKESDRTEHITVQQS